jgi:hypothetical protein
MQGSYTGTAGFLKPSGFSKYQLSGLIQNLRDRGSASKQDVGFILLNLGLALLDTLEAPFLPKVEGRLTVGLMALCCQSPTDIRLSNNSDGLSDFTSF